MVLISNFNTVNITSISPIERDVSEATVATQLGLSKNLQHLDKTRQIEIIRGYARYTLEHFPLSKNDLDD
jgi:hypothetical protein